MSLFELSDAAIEAGVPIPTRVHEADAGFDLRALHGGTVSFGKPAIVETGVTVNLDPGTVGLVCGRSGLAMNYSIGITQGTGVIDAGYQGEISVFLVNHSERPYQWEAGDRIAQLVIVDLAEIQPASMRHDAGLASADDVFARNLRATRSGQDLTQEELASSMTRLGYTLHVSAVGKIERGQRRVTVGEALAISHVLGVELSDMLPSPVPAFEIPGFEDTNRMLGQLTGRGRSGFGSSGL